MCCSCKFKMNPAGVCRHEVLYIYVLYVPLTKSVVLRREKEWFAALKYLAVSNGATHVQLVPWMTKSGSELLARASVTELGSCMRVPLYVFIVRDKPARLRGVAQAYHGPSSTHTDTRRSRAELYQ